MAGKQPSGAPSIAPPSIITEHFDVLLANKDITVLSETRAFGSKAFVYFSPKMSYFADGML